MVSSVGNRVFAFTGDGKRIDRKTSYDDYLTYITENKE